MLHSDIIYWIWKVIVFGEWSNDFVNKNVWFWWLLARNFILFWIQTELNVQSKTISLIKKSTFYMKLFQLVCTSKVFGALLYFVFIKEVCNLYLLLILKLPNKTKLKPNIYKSTVVVKFCKLNILIKCRTY